MATPVPMQHDALVRYANEHDNMQIVFRHRKGGTTEWSQLCTGVVVSPPGGNAQQLIVAERLNVGKDIHSAFSKKGPNDDYWVFPDKGIEYADVCSLVRWMRDSMLASSVAQQNKAVAAAIADAGRELAARDVRITEYAETTAGLTQELQARDVQLAKRAKEAADLRRELDELKKKPRPGDDLPPWARTVIERQAEAQKQMAEIFSVWSTPRADAAQAKPEAHEHTWHYLPSWQAMAADPGHFGLALKMHFGISGSTPPTVQDAFAALQHWLKKADWDDSADVVAGRRLLRALRNASCDVPVDEVLAVLRADGDADITGPYSAKDIWQVAHDKVAEKHRAAAAKKKDNLTSDSSTTKRVKKCYHCGRDGHTAHTCKEMPVGAPIPTAPTEEAKAYRRKNGLGGF
jgi:hypothetical protein